MISKSEILLSIICRSYNGEKYIYSALKSLADNLNSSCEVIIVDNGSIDKTLKRIEDFKKMKNILYFKIHTTRKLCPEDHVIQA